MNRVSNAADTHCVTVFLDSVRLHATTGPLATRLHSLGEPAAIAWLDALPELAVAACERWSFTPTLAHSAGSVAPGLLACTGRLSGGHKAVLILCPDAISASALDTYPVLQANTGLTAFLLDWTPISARLITSDPQPA